MTRLTKAQMEARLLKGAGQAGSGGRSRALGEHDPRHRRGAQSEGVAMQRFHPDHFEMDDEQRLNLVEPPTATQVACMTIFAQTVTPPNDDSYTNVPISTADSSVDTGDPPLITIDGTAETITLRAGRIYRVDADGTFRNTHVSATRFGYLRVARNDESEVYGTRFTQLSFAAKPSAGTTDTTIRTLVQVTAVIDLRDASSDAVIAVQAAGSNTSTDVVMANGRITVQTL